MLHSGLRQMLDMYGNDTASYYKAIWSAAAGAPAFWDQELNAWIVVSYTECASLLRSASVRRPKIAFPRTRDDDLNFLFDITEELMNMQMIFSEGDAAAKRRRRWASKLFPEAALRLPAADLTTIASETIYECAGKGYCNLY